MTLIVLISLILLVWIHTIADFWLQTRKLAETKSSNIVALTKHVAIYTTPLFLFGWQFALINGALHWMTDFCTSKLTTHFYKKENTYAFFGVIGIDQAIHMTCLILTYYWLIL